MFKGWKPFLFYAAVLVIFSNPVNGQDNLKSAGLAAKILSERGEVIIRFKMSAGISMDEITRMLSIDDYRNDTVTAYANDDAFQKFRQTGIPYEIIQPYSAAGIAREVLNRNGYPSYSEYVALMNLYAEQFPDICVKQDFGTSINGHKLIALKITDHPGLRENEPVIFFSASMHGDEPAGYVLMLNLIDSLLNGYSSGDYVRNLVEHTEIWINPLTNPDGAYFLSDSSVNGSTRFNAAQVDLNRDFPRIGNTIFDSAGRQPETRAMIGFITKIRPVLSVNFHSGAEVVNYPWDTWQSKHADDSWYWQISRAYADTAHKYSKPGYMTFLNDGIVRGIEWYQVYGSRQDFVNYYVNDREVTIEISDNKLPVGTELQNLWDYNKRSLLQYMNQVFTGFSGTISDSLTGEPIEGRIQLLNYDFDNSSVFSRPDDGSYFRLLKAGNYNAVFSAPGYKSKQTSVSVENNKLTTIDVALSRDLKLKLYPNPFTDHFYLNIPYPGYILYVYIIDMQGRKIKQMKKLITVPGHQEIRIGGLASGNYIVHVVYNGQSWDLPGIHQNP